MRVGAEEEVHSSPEAPTATLRVKNIEVVTDQQNAAGELFAATEDEFALIFGDQNFAVMSRVASRVGKVSLFAALVAVFQRPVLPGPATRVDGVLLKDDADRMRE